MSELQPNLRLLVTGAAGFIGSHVVDRLLAEGHRVWGLDNFDNFYPRSIKEANLGIALTHPGFEMVEGDLRDDILLNTLFREGQFDAVVHLAARAGVRPSIEAPDEYYDCNVMGTVRLLEVMRRYRVDALVFASSSSVYGSRDGSTPFSEDDSVDHPVSPYAASKRAGELLCHTYSHLHGLRCYCLRFFTVYGPRQRPDLAIHKFAKAIGSCREVSIYGDGSASRDFTYIDDTVAAIRTSLCHLLDSGNGPSFSILNIGADRTVTVRELVDLLAEAMDAVPNIEHLPPQPGDVPCTWADISRARQVLGYSPTVPIEEGLRRFVAWFFAKQECGPNVQVHGLASSTGAPAERPRLP